MKGHTDNQKKKSPATGSRKTDGYRGWRCYGAERHHEKMPLRTEMLGVGIEHGYGRDIHNVTHTRLKVREMDRLV